LEEEKGRLEGVLNDFSEELQRQKDAQEENERVRREAAEANEKQRALEAEARAAQDRQRERERANQDLQDMQRRINEWHKEMDEIYRKLETTTDAKEYQQYDASLREISHAIEEEHLYMMDVEAYLQQLDRDDEEQQRYLDQVAAEERQQQLDAAQEQIDGLQGLKDHT
jgi:septation ring formation regulator EzrA